MSITVVDGGNLEQAITEAGIDPAELEAKTAAKAEAKAEKKAEAKTDTKADKTDEKGKPAADAEDDADDVEDDEGVTARQKRELSGKMLKAIGKKHRQVKEAEEFAAHQYREKQQAEARAQDLADQLQRLNRQPTKEEVAPTRESFANEGEYIDAKIKWGVDQGIKQREAEKAVAERTASVQEQFKKAAELVPDFEAVTSVQLNYPKPIVAHMRESDMFAELGYHFAKNPKALERLASLTPVRQLVELGKIEATLQPFVKAKASSEASNGDKPSAVDTGFSPSKARSDAPVIKPLTGGEGSVEPDPRGMTTRQQIESFQRTNKVNLHARKRH